MERDLANGACRLGLEREAAQPVRLFAAGHCRKRKCVIAQLVALLSADACWLPICVAAGRSFNSDWEWLGFTRSQI
jgi:hypothetical protein